MHRQKISSVAGLAFLALVVALAAGCGGSSKKASSTTTTAATTTGATTITTPAADSKIAAEVPTKFKSKTMVIATDATYAPNEFIGTNGKSIEGMDPDLGKALGAVMGVKVKFVNTSFDGIIPGLAEDRRLRHLLPGRHFVLRQGGGRTDDQLACRPLRTLGWR